jgi:hypothetical protein
MARESHRSTEAVNRYLGQFDRLRHRRREAAVSQTPDHHPFSEQDGGQFFNVRVAYNSTVGKNVGARLTFVVCSKPCAILINVGSE